MVLIAQLAHHLAEYLTWRGLSELILLFIPVWWAWTNEVYYTTRFGSDADKVKRFMATVQLSGLVVVAAAIGKGLEHSAPLWDGAYALIRTVQLLELMRAGRLIPQVRPFTTYFVRGHTVGVAVWWSSLLLPAPLQPWAWAIGLLIEMGTSLNAGALYRQFPPTLPICRNDVAWLLSGALALYLLTEATICTTGVGARQPTLALTWGVRLRLLTVPLILLIPVLSYQPYWLLASSASLLWLIALSDWYLGRRGQAQGFWQVNRGRAE